MESLSKRKAARVARNEHGTDENSVYVTDDKLQEMQHVGALIDLKLAKTDADKRNVDEMQAIATWHGAKAEMKAKKQEETAQQDAEAAAKAPTENQKQGAQPGSAVEDDGEKKGAGAGKWKANK